MADRNTSPLQMQESKQRQKTPLEVIDKMKHGLLGTAGHTNPEAV